MNTTQPGPSRYVVLAAIEESPIATRVLSHVASLVRGMRGAEVHLLHIPDRFTNADVTTMSFDLEHARSYIDDCVRTLHATSGVTAVGHLLESEPASATLQLAASLDADLIVVGTKDRHGPERWLLGSVAQKVMQRAACPVLVVRSKDHVAASAPEIEPPCPDCLHEQRSSGGAELWCGRHREHHPRMRLHYESPPGFGAGSSLIQS